MKYYNFTNTELLVNGVAIKHFGDGDDVIALTKRVESYTDQVGADGNMVVIGTADQSGKFDIKLQQTSESNQYLMGLFTLQGSADFKAVSVSFIDTENLDGGRSSRAYITKPADITRGKGLNDQTWSIIAEDVDHLFEIVAEVIGL